MKKKIYLMIYDLGSAHRSTANSLREVIEQQNLAWEVHIVDFFKEIIGNTRPHYVFNNLVLQKKWARIINEPILTPLFKLEIRLQHSRWLKLLKKYWQEHQPDMVVSILPFVNKVLYQSLKEALPKVPFITLPTDAIDYPQHFWYEKQHEFAICLSPKAVEQVKKLGYQEESIFSTSGVVINPRFYQPITADRSLERKRLGLDPNLPTGLIFFGGQGSDKMLQIADFLTKSDLKIQLIFICGRNQQLAEKLRSQQYRFPTVVEGFTKEIPYYMHLSDFLVGKPGAGCINEAVKMKLPVITEYNSMTLFQERFNPEWIEKKQLGVVVQDFNQIETAVAKLIQPENLSFYRKNTSAINNKAVFEVVDIFKKVLTSK